MPKGLKAALFRTMSGRVVQRSGMNFSGSSKQSLPMQYRPLFSYLNMHKVVEELTSADCGPWTENSGVRRDVLSGNRDGFRFRLSATSAEKSRVKAHSFVDDSAKVTDLAQILNIIYVLDQADFLSNLIGLIWIASQFAESPNECPRRWIAIQSQPWEKDSGINK